MQKMWCRPPMTGAGIECEAVTDSAQSTVIRAIMAKLCIMVASTFFLRTGRCRKRQPRPVIIRTSAELTSIQIIRTGLRRSDLSLELCDLICSGKH